MNGSFFTLLLGFLLGIKHALEADHVVAVSTIVTQQKNPFRVSLTGTFWGIGHTTVLFIVGFIVLFFKISIPPFLGLLFEFMVGCMLIFLGIKTVMYQEATGSKSYFHHQKPYAIGMIHGLAGSGGLMLLVLGSVQSFFEGLLYIALFGAGSILSMTVMSFLIGIPFMLSTKKMPFLHRYLAIVAGGLSLAFGVTLVSQISMKLANLLSGLH